jgi:hypothetical protein
VTETSGGDITGILLMLFRTRQASDKPEPNAAAGGCTAHRKEGRGYSLPNQKVHILNPSFQCLDVVQQSRALKLGTSNFLLSPAIWQRRLKHLDLMAQLCSIVIERMFPNADWDGVRFA